MRSIEKTRLEKAPAILFQLGAREAEAPRTTEPSPRATPRPTEPSCARVEPVDAADCPPANLLLPICSAKGLAVGDLCRKPAKRDRRRREAGLFTL